MQTEVWTRATPDRFEHAEWPVALEFRPDGWHVIGGAADGQVWPTLSQAKQAAYGHQ